MSDLEIESESTWRATRKALLSSLCFPVLPIVSIGMSLFTWGSESLNGEHWRFLPETILFETAVMCFLVAIAIDFSVRCLIRQMRIRFILFPFLVLIFAYWQINFQVGTAVLLNQEERLRENREEMKTSLPTCSAGANRYCNCYQQ